MPAPWEAVGLTTDLTNGIVMHGQCQDVELAIWRSASGKLSAWKDRCPHRGMRLSHGFVRGETLSCIYHGWVYETSGSCSRIPAHPDLVPPAAITAETFQCVEQNGAIFVAPTGETLSLPVLDGLKPIRSLVINLGLKHIHWRDLGLALAADGTIRGTIELNSKTIDICLLVQSPGPDETHIHALASQQADFIAVSRWLEAIRRQIESKVAA